jgi:hypothetical protein
MNVIGASGGYHRLVNMAVLPSDTIYSCPQARIRGLVPTFLLQPCKVPLSLILEHMAFAMD